MPETLIKSRFKCIRFCWVLVLFSRNILIARVCVGGGGRPPFLHKLILDTLGPTQPRQHKIALPRAYYSTSVVLQHATLRHMLRYSRRRFCTAPTQTQSDSTHPVSEALCITYTIIFDLYYFVRTITLNEKNISFGRYLRWIHGVLRHPGMLPVRTVPTTWTWTLSSHLLLLF